MNLKDTTERLTAAIEEARNLIIGKRVFMYQDKHDYDHYYMVTENFTVFHMMSCSTTIREVIALSELGDVVELGSNDMLIVTQPLVGE